MKPQVNTVRGIATKRMTTGRARRVVDGMIKSELGGLAWRGDQRLPKQEFFPEWFRRSLAKEMAFLSDKGWSLNQMSDHIGRRFEIYRQMARVNGY